MSEAPRSFAVRLRWAGKVVHCPACGHRGALDLGQAFQPIVGFLALHCYACPHCLQPGQVRLLAPAGR